MIECDLSFSETLILSLGAIGMGMMLLVKGGNWTVDAAVYLARHMGVSRLLVGLTIVAFGTSLPELLVSVNSNYHDLPGLSLGNVIGSNIANILLVVGITGIFATLHASGRARRDLAVMMAVSVLLAFLMHHGVIGHVAGLAMVFLLLAYTLWEYWLAKREGITEGADEDEPVFANMKISLAYLLGGLAAISFGAEFLVRGAKTGAEIIGVPDTVIGLSLIAIGTSLPELTTCVIAALKRQTDIVLGNIIGSNIFNILMIVGVTAAIKPLDLSLAAPELIEFDIWVLLVVSGFFATLLLFYKKINRVIGICLLVSYFAYMGYIFTQYVT